MKTKKKTKLKRQRAGSTFNKILAVEGFLGNSITNTLDFLKKTLHLSEPTCKISYLPNKLEVSINKHSNAFKYGQKNLNKKKVDRVDCAVCSMRALNFITDIEADELVKQLHTNGMHPELSLKLANKYIKLPDKFKWVWEQFTVQELEKEIPIGYALLGACIFNKHIDKNKNGKTIISGGHSIIFRKDENNMIKIYDPQQDFYALDINEWILNESVAQNNGKLLLFALIPKSTDIECKLFPNIIDVFDSGIPQKLLNDVSKKFGNNRISTLEYLEKEFNKKTVNNFSRYWNKQNKIKKEANNTKNEFDLNTKIMEKIESIGNDLSKLISEIDEKYGESRIDIYASLLHILDIKLKNILVTIQEEEINNNEYNYLQIKFIDLINECNNDINSVKNKKIKNDLISFYKSILGDIKEEIVDFQDELITI